MPEGTPLGAARSESHWNSSFIDEEQALPSAQRRADVEGSVEQRRARWKYQRDDRSDCIPAPRLADPLKDF